MCENGPTSTTTTSVRRAQPLSLSLALLTLLTEREGMCESQFTRVQISGQTKKGFQIPGNKEQQHLRANPPLRPPVSLHRVRHIHATSFQNKGFLPRRHISLSLSLSITLLPSLPLSLVLSSQSLVHIHRLVGG